jgi:hypothetical protein
MHTEKRDCEILGNQCIVSGRFLPGTLDQSSEYDFRLMRLAPKGCDPDLFLEKNRSKAQHVIFVFRTTFKSAVTVIEIRNNQGGGWFDKDMAANLAKSFVRNASAGLI